MIWEQPRVLVVHNRYQQRGGEDLVFEAETALLEQHGHAVDRLEFTNDVIPEAPGLVERGRLALSTVWSRSGARAVSQRAQAFGAEIVHFHNTFPLVSPAAFGAARGTGAAVVASLHNYRFVCPSADLFRAGSHCEDCLGRRLPWPSVKHGCYHDSPVQTGAIAATLAFHGARRTWSRDIDLALTPSEAAARLLEGAIPAGRLRVKPNFVAGEVTVPPEDAPRAGVLYVGRLTVEKGIPLLLEAWRRHTPGPLTIVGDGPERAAVEAAAAVMPSVTYIGEAERSEVLAAMQQAAALIVPSVWQEPFGLVVVEALASATPVIAARSGALPELVTEGESGFLYEALDPDDLVRAVRAALADPSRLRTLGQQGRVVYETRYSAEVNYELLLGAYQEALRHRRAH